MSEHNTQPSPRILRMEQELVDIQEKCNKIREFTKSEAWNKVDQLNRELLGAQYSAMQNYARILNIRLKIAYGQDAKAGRPAPAAQTKPETRQKPAQNAFRKRR